MPSAPAPEAPGPPSEALSPRWLEGIPVPSALVTEAGRIAAASRAFTEVSGWMGSVIGSSLPSLFAPGDGEALGLEVCRDQPEREQTFWVTLASTGRSCQLRLGRALVEGNGTVRLAMLLPAAQRSASLSEPGWYWDRSGEPASAATAAQRLAELPLSGLFIADGRVVVATERAAHLLSVPATKLRGKPVVDLLGSRATDVTDPALEASQCGPRPLAALPVYLGGSLRALAYCLIPLARPRLGLLLVEACRDSKLESPARSPHSTASYLIAGVAHEINNPLTFVAPALSQLREELARRRNTACEAPVGRWLELAEEAETGVARIAGVVKRLREMREGRPDIEPTDINGVVLETLRLSAGSIPSSVVLRRDFGMARPARANRERLAQVLLNLVLNAAHALTEDCKAGGTIFLRTWASVSHAFLEVRDDGTGIQPSLREKIFEPFFTTRGSGSGLGLALCRSMIRELGGELSLEDGPGPGARFRIRLPLWQGPAGKARLRSRAPAKPIPFQERRVLLVDDDHLVRRALARMLAKHHDITEASSVAQALELIAASHPPFEVLVTDLVMRDGGGRELIAALKRLDSPLAQRAIIISGMAPDATPLDCPRLSKPCTAQDMLSMIDRVVAAPRDSESLPPDDGEDTRSGA